MNKFRFAITAVVLMLPFGLAQATALNPTPPPPSLTNPHPSFSVAEARTLSLRESGSQIVVDTIENALRWGGFKLFDERFQLDSSLGWVFGETIEGEVDAVIPLWGKGKQAVFVQPGAVFWTGLEEAERIDGNFGVVYRAVMADDVIGGASVFYDHDFEIGHQRIGIGVDVQRSGFHGAFNYYHPLSDTQDGREGYIEDALQGMDVSLAIESHLTRVGGNVGYWKFQGDEETRDEWNLSFGIDAGLRIIPGVFLEGSLQNHDDDVSLGRRASVGLAFRFSLPGLKGKSYGDSGRVLSLYKPVHREKRILYEEREANSPVQLTPVDESGQPLTRTSTIEEGNTVTIAGELEALPEPAMLELVIDEDASSADLGADFSYGHEVYVLDEATGQQSAPGTVTDCPEARCQMMIPAGVTRFDVEIEILTDTAEKEAPEEIVLQVHVPEEHQRAIRDGETTVTIRAHGNEIGFAADAVATLMENNETDGVQVLVNIDEPSPVPITLDVATSGTATEGTDYDISTRSLEIPANASSASLTLWGNDNNEGEGSKTITLTLSGDLPEGWAITDGEHTVTLQDDDLAIFFTSATTTRVEEPGTGSNATVTVAVGITQPPTANITVRVEAGGTGETASPGSSLDYTFTGMNFTFGTNDHADKTATFSVHPDNMAEPDETIVLTLADVGGSVAAEPSGFSLGLPHTITIPTNDNTVGFASNAVTTLAENNVTTGVEVSISIDRPSPVPITLNVATSGTATDTGTNPDYSISTKSLEIPANASSASLTLKSIDNRVGGGNKSIILRLSGNLPEGWAITDDEHTVTIQDDDLSIGFAEASETIDEPASDTDYTVDITISQAPATTPVTLQISRAAVSTTDMSGSDVTFSPSSVTFMPGGSTSETVTLNVKHDTVPEDAEFIELELGDSGNTRMSGGNMFPFGIQKYRLNINASDTHTVSISAGNHQTEGGPVRRPEIVVRPAFSQNLKVNVKVSDDSTAVAGMDYTDNIPSSVTILPNNSGWNINVDVIDDGDDEITETVILEIEEPSGADEWPPGVILDQSMARHVFSIFDNDVPANTIGFNTVLSETTAIEGAGEFNTGSANLELEIAQGLPSAVSVTVTISGVSNPNDYVFYIFPPMQAPERNPNPNNVLSIPMGARNFPFILAAPEDGDTNDENITLTLSSSNLPSGWSFGSTNSPNSWMLEIEDND